jgi:hypothetical protein
MISTRAQGHPRIVLRPARRRWSDRRSSGRQDSCRDVRRTGSAAGPDRALSLVLERRAEARGRRQADLGNQRCRKPRHSHSPRRPDRRRQLPRQQRRDDTRRDRRSGCLPDAVRRSEADHLLPHGVLGHGSARRVVRTATRPPSNESPTTRPPRSPPNCCRPISTRSSSSSTGRETTRCRPSPAVTRRLGPATPTGSRPA